MMAGIRSRDTAPELRVRRFLHAAGFRYRIAPKDLTGRPDIVLPKYRTIIFVHGCYWHRHEGCRYAAIPAANVDFWMKKFERNLQRDREVQETLMRAGWSVKVLWACELSDANLQKLLDLIKGNS